MLQPMHHDPKPILIVIAGALLLARLFQPGPAMFGENDRSRWATVRSLSEDGTYAIGYRTYRPEGAYQDQGIIAEKGWCSNDVVLHPDTGVFYSSKPPLLSTLVAGLCWLLNVLTGLSITSDTWLVTRCLLVLVNFVPLMVYLFLVNRLVNTLSGSDWGGFFVLSCACFGTFVTSFCVTLNNHTVAASSALYSLYATLQIMRAAPESPRSTLFATSGFFAGLTACMELPALSFLVGLWVFLVRRHPRQTLLWLTPAAFVPIAAFVATNYLAIGQLRVAYLEGGTSWYEFEGAYWRQNNMVGIDTAGLHETRFEYALHLLNGHHGFFSLTPIFLLALVPVALPALLAGAGAAEAQSAGRWPDAAETKPLFAQLATATVILTAVLYAFCIVRTNNYGGGCCGPRWLLWLTPFYVVSLIPAADYLGHTPKRRFLASALLVISIFSAHYRGNPWCHPWLYDLMSYFQLLPY